MNKIDSSARLTDAMEREFLMQAIEEQLRLRPVQALRGLMARLFSGKKRPAAKGFSGELKATH